MLWDKKFRRKYIRDNEKEAAEKTENAGEWAGEGRD